MSYYLSRMPVLFNSQNTIPDVSFAVTSGDGTEFTWGDGTPVEWKTGAVPATPRTWADETIITWGDGTEVEEN